MANEYEELLQDLLDDDPDDVTPKSDAEEALLNAIESLGRDGLSKPRSRIEAYLQAFAERVKGLPYKKTTASELTIEYDGTLSGKEYVELGEGTYYVKVSDVIPTRDELAAGTITTYYAGEVESWPMAEGIMDVMAGVIAVGEFLLVLQQDMSQEGLTLTAGMWTICIPGAAYIKGMYLPSVSHTVIKKLDPEMVDGEIPYLRTTTGELTIEIYGDISSREHVLVGVNAYLVKVSDVIPTKEELEAGNVTVSITGQTIIQPLDGLVEEGPFIDSNVTALQAMDMLFVLPEGFSESGVTLTAGMWVMWLVGEFDHAKLWLPSITHTSWKKLDANLIDAEWMAVYKDVEIPVVKEVSVEANVQTDVSLSALISVSAYESVKKAIIVLNGVEYTSTVEAVSGLMFFGNASLLSDDNPDTGEPFVGIVNGDTLLFSSTLSGTVSITLVASMPQPIPQEFLPAGLSGVTEVDFSSGNKFYIANALYNGSKDGSTVVANTRWGRLKLLHFNDDDVPFFDFFSAIFTDTDGCLYYLNGLMLDDHYVSEGEVTPYKMVDFGQSDLARSGATVIDDEILMGVGYGFAPISATDIGIPHKKVAAGYVLHNVVVPVHSSASGISGNFYIDPSKVIHYMAAGRKYRVTIDGVDYDVTADSDWFLGASSHLGMSEDVPFSIRFYTDSCVINVLSCLTGEVTLSIYLEDDVIVPLASEKYLPESVINRLAELEVKATPFDVYFSTESEDNDYMYKTSDTSDESQRLTLEELSSVMNSGRTIRMINAENSGIGYAYPAGVQIADEGGIVYTNLGTITRMFYTYDPELTE